jgi:hypothetical protein
MDEEYEALMKHGTWFWSPLVIRISFIANGSTR